jgi:hypothetical protein
MSTHSIENWKYEYAYIYKASLVLAKRTVSQSVWTEAQEGVPYPGRPLFIQIY